MTTFRLLFLCALAVSIAAGPARAQDHPETESRPAPPWGRAILAMPDAWYASPAAVEIAHTVIRHQSQAGGWPKNTDLTRAPQGERGLEDGDTFDNDATITPMAYLARVAAHSGDAQARAAFERGLDYVLSAQYPNGGWPQFFPLRGGYHDHITFNDDAMVNILDLLQDIALQRAPYGLVDAERRERAAQALNAGVELILALQLDADGRPAVWAAQYDNQTLAPSWGRAYEPPSLSGAESVGVVRFLMSLPDPSPRIVAAVDGAVAWFETSAMTDVGLETFTAPDGRPDRRLAPAPGRRLWARFYDLDTQRPVYMGRDSVARERLEDIEHERRNGYNYVGVWPERLLTEDYPRWRGAIPSARP